MTRFSLPSRDAARRAALIPLALALGAAPVLAQSVPETELGKPDATLSKGIERLGAIYELADRRVLLVEGRMPRLLIADFATGKLEERLENGLDDDKVRSLSGLWRWRGDSVATADPARGQLYILGPDGTRGRSLRIGDPMRGPGAGGAPAGGAAGAAGTPPAANAAAANGGANAGANAPAGPRTPSLPQFRSLIGSQLIVGTGYPPRPPRTNISVAPPRQAYPVVRFSLATLTYDTVTQLLPLQAPKPAFLNPNLATFTTHFATSPVQAVDAFATLSDGTVAVLRAATYRLDLFALDGTRTQAGPVPFEPIAVTDEDRKRIVDDQKRAVETLVRMNASRFQGITVAYEDPPSWPTTHPPFRGDVAPIVDREDRIWVATRCAKDAQAWCYDAIDRSGARAGRLRLPPRTQIAGFGFAAIYTVNLKDPEHPVVQRHPLPF